MTQNFKEKRIHNAAVVDRIKAFLIDMFMIMMPIAYLLAYGIYGGKDDFQANPTARWLLSFIFGLIVVLFWSKSGQTPGYKAYNLVVLDNKTGRKPSFMKALIRYVLFLFSAMSVVGLAIAFFRDDKKTLQDLLSETTVIAFGRLEP